MTTQTLSPLQRLSNWFWLKQVRSNKRSLSVDRLQWSADLKVTHVMSALVITAVSMMVAAALITTPEQVALWVAYFLTDVNQRAGGQVDFWILLKSFGAALIILINFTVTIFVVSVQQPEVSDVLQTISESDDRVMDRIAVMEHSINERLDGIERNAVGIPAEAGNDQHEQ